MRRPSSSGRASLCATSTRRSSPRTSRFSACSRQPARSWCARATCAPASPSSGSRRRSPKASRPGPQPQLQSRRRNDQEVAHGDRADLARRSGRGRSDRGRRRGCSGQPARRDVERDGQSARSAPAAGLAAGVHVRRQLAGDGQRVAGDPHRAVRQLGADQREAVRGQRRDLPLRPGDGRPRGDDEDQPQHAPLTGRPDDDRRGEGHNVRPDREGALELPRACHGRADGCRAHSGRAVVSPEVAMRGGGLRPASARLVTRARPRNSGRPVKRPNFAGWLVFALVAVAAEVAVRAFDLHDSVAAPSEALRALADGLRSGTLTSEIGTTLAAFAGGLAIAIGLGVGLGVVIGSSRLLLDAFSVVIEFLRPIPGVALIPLAILFLGLGTATTRFVVAYACVWPILINTFYGVRGTDPMLHDVARTSGVTWLGRIFRVALPAALPSIAAGIRVSASIALLVAVTAEFIVGLDGIGAYMQRQQQAFQIPELYAAVVLVGLVGYALNVVLRTLQRHVVFWVGEDRAGVP